MAAATYTVEIDFNKNQQYDHAASDITTYVLEMAWNNGMAQSDQVFAPPAQLTITVDIRGGEFDLENSGSTFHDLLKRGLLVRVQATFASTTRTLFVGTLTDVTNVSVGELGVKTAQLIVQDLMLALLDAEFRPALQTNVTTDVALMQVFESGQIVLPYASDHWVLGASISELGTNTRLPDATQFADFETGITTLAFVGDNLGTDQGMSAQGFLREIVAAEAGGRFWFDVRTGKFTFHSRHHDINPTIVDTVTAGNLYGGRYIAADEPYSQVTIAFEPREIGAAGSVLWSQAGTLELKRGQTRTINARYRDPNENGVRVGGIDFIVPARGADMIANTEPDGSGEDVTDKIAFSVEFGASSAKISVSNDAVKVAHVTTLQVRGTPLKSYQRQQVTAMDADAIAEYGRREQVLQVRAIDDEEFAQGYAGYWLAKHKAPWPRFETVTIVANKTAADMTRTLTRTIGDAFVIPAASLLSSPRQYVIVGERHRVLAGGENTHEVTWVLKPLEWELFWVLGEVGYSGLGLNTVLAL